MSQFEDETLASACIAKAIGRVIAEKTIQVDPMLRRLDALGRASAIHTMASNMVPELRQEADAAVKALVELGWRCPVAEGAE